MRVEKLMGLSACVVAFGLLTGLETTGAVLCGYPEYKKCPGCSESEPDDCTCFCGPDCDWEWHAQTALTSWSRGGPCATHPTTK